MAAHIEIKESPMGEAILSPVRQRHFLKAEPRPEAKSGLLHMISHCERGRHLAELEEARGTLLRVQEKDGFCTAIFEWGAVILPGEFKDKLAPLIGRKAGILRLDGYHIRELL